VSWLFHSSFMKDVENTMSGGLNIMRLLSSVLAAGEQLDTCKQKLSESTRQAQSNRQVHDILVEMASTAISALSVSFSRCAEASMECAVAGAELYHSMSSVMAMAEAEALSEARREAEAKDRENEMCAEDRVFMAERARKDREELTKQAERQFEEELRQQREEAKQQQQREDDEDNVQQLRVKIKSLQVQLRVQHVQALQTLNRDARSLQRQLQGQLMQLLDKSILDMVDTETESLKIGVKSSAPSTLRSSLLSLLADFLDSSCNALRSEFRSGLETPKIDNAITEQDSSQISSEVQILLNRHFGWLTIFKGSKPASVMAEGGRGPDTVPPPPQDHTAAAENPVVLPPQVPTSLHDIDGEFDENTNCASESCEDSGEVKGHNEKTNQDRNMSDVEQPTTDEDKQHDGLRLALLPDYRSRAVWLACLLDLDAVQTLVGSELHARVCDDVQKCLKGHSHMTASKQALDQIVNDTCTLVCAGLSHIII
jgi:hypothetical protein